MRNYGLAVLGLSETIWNQAGQLTLPSGKVILFSGHKEDGAAHTHGVALMLSRKAAKSLVAGKQSALELLRQSSLPIRRRSRLVLYSATPLLTTLRKTRKKNSTLHYRIYLTRREEKILP